MRRPLRVVVTRRPRGRQPRRAYHLAVPSCSVLSAFGRPPVTFTVCRFLHQSGKGCRTTVSGGSASEPRSSRSLCIHGEVRFGARRARDGAIVVGLEAERQRLRYGDMHVVSDLWRGFPLVGELRPRPSRPRERCKNMSISIDTEVRLRLRSIHAHVVYKHRT